MIPCTSNRLATRLYSLLEDFNAAKENTSRVCSPLPCEQQSESRRREIRWWSSPWVPRPEAKPSAHQLPVTVRFSPADRTANHHHRTFQVFHNHQPGVEIHQSPMLGCVSSKTDLKTVLFLSIFALIGIEKAV